MMVVTFYSYKGGVGRSMALANVAELLVQAGRRVVMCDWDFEAPGLERFAVDEERRAEALRAETGMMDLLDEYKHAIAGTESVPSGKPRARDFVKVDDLVLRRPSSYAVPLRSHGTGSLHIVTAGRRDGDNQRTYAGAVQAFDWTEFYEVWGGASYVEFFRRDLEDFGAEVVLVDSRTGVTEQGGVCTHHLADLVVLMCAASDQNIFGTRWMLDGLARSDLKGLRGGRKLETMVVAARIDPAAEVQFLGEFRTRFRAAFEEDGAPKGVEAHQFLIETEIPYLAHYAFRERIVARADEKSQAGARSMLAAYQALAKAIDRRYHVKEADAEVPLVPGTTGTDLAGSVEEPAVQLESAAAESLPPQSPEDPLIELDALYKLLIGAATTGTESAQITLLGVRISNALVQARAGEQLLAGTRRRHLFATVAGVAAALALLIVFVVHLNSDRATSVSLQNELAAATRSLQDKADTAKSQAEVLKSKAEAAQSTAEQAAATASKLREEAEATNSKQKDLYDAAVRRAQDARQASEKAGLLATAALAAQKSAEDAASKAAADAAAASKEARQAKADLDLARQALEAERNAKKQTETQLAAQKGTLDALQGQFAEVTSQLTSCQHPLKDALKSSKDDGS